MYYLMYTNLLAKILGLDQVLIQIDTQDNLCASLGHISEIILKARLKIVRVGFYCLMMCGRFSDVVVGCLPFQTYLSDIYKLSDSQHS